MARKQAFKPCGKRTLRLHVDADLHAAFIALCEHAGLSRADAAASALRAWLLTMRANAKEALQTGDLPPFGMSSRNGCRR